jgi:hypothetical protein
VRIHLGDDIREVDFPIGSMVYLKARDEPLRGVVCGYAIGPCQVTYEVYWGDGTDARYHGFELSSTFEREYHAA